MIMDWCPVKPRPAKKYASRQKRRSFSLILKRIFRDLRKRLVSIVTRYILNGKGQA